MTVESKLLALRATLRGLRTPGEILVKTACSSNEKVLSAAAGTGAVDGETTLTIDQVASASRATAGADLFSTTDTVALGPGTFEFRVGEGEPQVIELTSLTTLSQLVRAINTLGAGATAASVDVGTGESRSYRLEIVANETGSGSNLTVINDDTKLDVSASAGTDARFAIAGSLDTIEGASNLLVDVIPGVTVILKESGSSAQVTVSNDSNAIQAKVQVFVDAFNDLIEFVGVDKTLTRRGTEKSSFGALATGPMVRDVLDQLQKHIRTWIADPGGDIVLSLAGIGIATRSDGGLTFDKTKFQSELALNPQNVSKVFGGVENGSGVGELLYNSISKFIRACGLTETVPEGSDNLAQGADRVFENGAGAMGENRSNLVTHLTTLEHSLDTIRSQGELLLEHLSAGGCVSTGAGSRTVGDGRAEANE